ncbi:hypothetical protein IQ250_25240 [Pseudanabaenaceae cyanobacterium LEGE 13415]|nr:hypothetical protein [Pseudanabaenaceae cyanobacterium LEGE 13415]
MFFPKEIGYHLAISQLEQMSRYLDTMNAAIQSSQQQFMADLEITIKDMNEAEKSDFYNSYENEIIELGSDFPTMLFSSFVISWYSFIEHQLISLCKTLDLRISVSVKDDTRYGEGIRRAYKFLDEAGGYKIDNAHWQELIKVGKIRNRLVHEGGVLLPKPIKPSEGKSVKVDLGEDGTVYLPIDDEFYRYLTEQKLYRVGGSRFTPDHSYCKHLLSFGTELLTKICQDLKFNI